MSEIFSPYLSFIVFFIVIVVNIFLIIKKVDWILLIVANLILNIVLAFFGLSSISFLADIVSEFVDLIGDFLKDLLF